MCVIYFVRKFDLLLVGELDAFLSRNLTHLGLRWCDCGHLHWEIACPVLVNAGNRTASVIEKVRSRGRSSRRVDTRSSEKLGAVPESNIMKGGRGVLI